MVGQGDFAGAWLGAALAYKLICNYLYERA